jgi:hypothetical protein
LLLGAESRREESMRKLLLVTVSFLVINGCQTTDPALETPSKDDVTDRKADGFDVCTYFGHEVGCDLCQILEWYGDGECDQSLIDQGLCIGPDPDCEATDEIEFSSFRRHMSNGPCPPGLDCSGLMELRADGTLLVDRVGEALEEPRQAQVSDEDLEYAIAVFTKPALVELLDLDETPCPEPSDIYEAMILTEVDGTEHSNGTTFCNEVAISDARNVIEDLADRYIPEQPTFSRFRMTTSDGWCPPSASCTEYMELHEDGTLLVVRRGEAADEPRRAQVTAEELERAIAILTNVELIQLLDLDSSPCAPVSDLSESMALYELDGEEHSNSTTFCGQAPISAARDMIDELADVYFPAD